MARKRTIYEIGDIQFTSPTDWLRNRWLDVKDRIGYHFQTKRFYVINYFHDGDRIKTAPRNRKPDAIGEGAIRVFGDPLIARDVEVTLDRKRSLMDTLDKKHLRLWYHQTVRMERPTPSEIAARITDRIL